MGGANTAPLESNVDVPNSNVDSAAYHRLNDFETFDQQSRLIDQLPKLNQSISIDLGAVALEKNENYFKENPKSLMVSDFLIESGGKNTELSVNDSQEDYLGSKLTQTETERNFNSSSFSTGGLAGSDSIGHSLDDENFEFEIEQNNQKNDSNSGVTFNNSSRETNTNESAILTTFDTTKTDLDYWPGQEKELEEAEELYKLQSMENLGFIDKFLSTEQDLEVTMIPKNQQTQGNIGIEAQAYSIDIQKQDVPKRLADDEDNEIQQSGDNGNRSDDSHLSNPKEGDALEISNTLEHTQVVGFNVMPNSNRNFDNEELDPQQVR